MFKVRLRFYEELNDFLPHKKRKQELEISFENPRSVKDIIESLGVPHTEVDLIVANGVSVDFSYIAKDNDYVSVYPVFESIDISGAKHLMPPLRMTKFVVDVPQRRLARYLRALGFDTIWGKNYSHRELVRISTQEGRILLTRSPNLLKFKELTHAIFIRKDDPKKQLKEVFERLDIHNAVQPFTRCIECNGLFEPVSKDEVIGRIPDGVKSWCNSFVICKACGKIYWEGSHVSRMSEWMKDLGV